VHAKKISRSHNITYNKGYYVQTLSTEKLNPYKNRKLQEKARQGTISNSCQENSKSVEKIC